MSMITIAITLGAIAFLFSAIGIGMLVTKSIYKKKDKHPKFKEMDQLLAHYGFSNVVLFPNYLYKMSEFTFQRNDRNDPVVVCIYDDELFGLTSNGIQDGLLNLLADGIEEQIKCN